MTDTLTRQSDHPDPDGTGLSRKAMFLIGFASSIAGVTLLALFMLVGRSGVPNYTSTTNEPATAVSGGPTDAAPVADLDIVATEFAFEPADGTSAAPLRLTLENQGAVLHNLEFEGLPEFVLEAEPGATAAETIALEPGTYVIFCNIPGHRDAGMEGTITVSG